jgi:hypothetical protein
MSKFGKDSCFLIKQQENNNVFYIFLYNFSLYKIS